MKPFEKILILGDEGELVSDLQERLIQLGFTSCYIEDGKSIGVLDKPTGYFGETTQELLSKFQAQVLDFVVTQSIPTDLYLPNYEKVNGGMDFPTWWVLNNYEKLSEFYKKRIDSAGVPIPEDEPQPEIYAVPPIVELKNKMIHNVITYAHEELGTVEHGGNNMGLRVQQYQEIGSDGEVSGGQPWCQYFQNWLQIKAAKALGTEYKGLYSGYTPTWVNWGAQRHLTVKNPQKQDIEIGDLMYVYSASRQNACHVALIIGKNTNGSVTTIEGNTNAGGGSDGFGVFKRTRSIPWAIVKWHKLYE